MGENISKQKRILVDISFCAYGQAGIMSDLRNTIDALLQIPNLKVDFWLYSVHHNYDLMKQVKGSTATELEIVQMLSDITGTKKDRLSKIPGIKILRAIGNLGAMITRKHIPLVKISTQLKESIFRKYLLNGLGPSFLKKMQNIDVFISPFTDRAIHYRIHGGISTGNFQIDTSNYDFALFQTEVPIEVSQNTLKIIRHHDLIPFLMPDTEADAYHRSKFIFATSKICSNQNSLFICNSQKTQRELLQVFPEISLNHTTVVYCAVSPKFERTFDSNLLTETIKNTLSDKLSSLTSKNPTDTKKSSDIVGNDFNPEFDDYLLMVGLMDTRKNYKVAIKAMDIARREFKKEFPGRRLYLIIAGSVGTLDDESKGMLAKAAQKGSIIFLEKPSIDELKTLYSHAKALLFPSLNEGFGIPPIESMRCGTPVLSSDIEVHKEIQGEASVYFNPYDHVQLATEICKLLIARDLDSINDRIKKGLQISERYTDISTVNSWRQLFTNLSN